MVEQRRIRIALLAVVVGCSEPTTPVENTARDPVQFTSHGASGLQGLGCTHRWLAAVSGDWNDPARWSPPEVPVDTAVVCVDVDGTYDILLNRDDDSTAVAIAGLELGPATGRATLILGGNSLVLSAASGIDIRANGELRLRASPNAGIQLRSAGGIDNDGIIFAERSCPTCGDLDAIAASVANHGVVHVATTVTLGGADGTFTNTSAGAVQIDAGGELIVPSGVGTPSVTWHAGALYGEGRMTVLSGDVIYNDGVLGVDSQGSAILQLSGANLTLGAPQTSGAAIAVGARHAFPVTVTGNLGSATTLDLHGDEGATHSSIAFGSSPLVAGTLILRAAPGDTLQLTGSGPLINAGTILAGDEGTSVIQLSMSAENGGTVTLGSSLAIDVAGGEFTNAGLVNGAAGLPVVVPPGVTFASLATGVVNDVTIDVRGGTLAGDGFVDVVASSSGGLVLPGSPVGALSIGTFVQDATSRLRLDVTGIADSTEYDRLSIARDASLDGVLEVVTAPAFTGGVCGETIDVLTIGGVASGMFAMVDGPIAPARAWRAGFVSGVLRLAGYDPTTPINLVGAPGSVAEGGAAATYSVCLGAFPTADVAITTVPDGQVTATPATHVFTVESAALPQTYSVQAVDDGAFEGPHSGVVVHAAASGDVAFDGQTVSMTVLIADNDNAPPSALPDQASVLEDGSIEIQVLANDTDVENDSLFVSAVTTPSHGSVTVTGAGSTVTYVPNADFSGSDVFSYTVSDAAGGVSSADVSVTVSPVNDTPQASDDAATTAEDVGVYVPVLANDSDADGDVLTILSISAAIHGAAVQNGSGIDYTPEADFNGTDTFSYVVSDGVGGEATGTVTVTVTSVNDVPVVANDDRTIDEDTPVEIAVLLNDSDIDGDALTIAQLTDPAHGSVTITGGGTTVTYTPAANYSGPDGFSYTVADGQGGIASGSVAIAVYPVNDAPFVVNDTATTWKGWKIMVGVLANDSDVEGDSIMLYSVGAPSKGVASAFHDQIYYTPVGTGPASVTYSASDRKGAISPQAKLDIAILPSPPVTDMQLGTITYTSGTGGPTGHQFTLTITYRNGGSALAPDLAITMDPVAGVKFRSTFKGDRCATLTSGITACQRPALAGNSSATFSLMRFTTLAKGNYTLTLRIAAPNPESKPGNNTKTIVVNVK
ncbi:MAG: hypothetical protein MNPFHGCM_00440 [Gemmatimonadaceae bacterium]|nr:hypothetical protein [Gemmatimonadaceae bacterium]